jgi:predicted nuclease of predicted toxin-antitoxin system
MLAFLMDHQVHLGITEGLRRRGIDVLTAWEDGRAEADDEELLERATALGRVFVSQDQDLLRITKQWQRLGRPFAGVVFAIQQDIDIGGTIEYLELVAHAMTADEMKNRVEYVPIRR